MTLNSIISKILKPIAEDHLMINEFGFGDLPLHLKNKAVKYPLMWVLVNNATYSNRDKKFNYNLSLVFTDIAKDDLTDCVAIQSDMIQVAADVAANLMYHESEDLEITNDFAFKPFTEKFADLNSGVIMDITISAVKSLSDCETPLNSKL